MCTRQMTAALAVTGVQRRGQPCSGPRAPPSSPTLPTCHGSCWRLCASICRVRSQMLGGSHWARLDVSLCLSAQLLLSGVHSSELACHSKLQSRLACRCLAIQPQPRFRSQADHVLPKHMSAKPCAEDTIEFRAQPQHISLFGAVLIPMCGLDPIVRCGLDPNAACRCHPSRQPRDPAAAAGRAF